MDRFTKDITKTIYATVKAYSFSKTAQITPAISYQIKNTATAFSSTKTALPTMANGSTISTKDKVKWNMAMADVTKDNGPKE